MAHRAGLFLMTMAACAPVDASLVAEGACPAIPTIEIPDGEAPADHFSFFVTSLRAMQTLSGCQAGFGGDLRYGESGAGAGLRGADKICAVIAETSLTGAGHKPWRAFLSVEADADGNRVDAIDRVGDGPWYDRLGRLVSNDKAGLLSARPAADNAIVDDLPNEDGVGNHQPDPALDEVDNHDTLTGSSSSGRLEGSTCLDWTSADGAEGDPKVGHAWPRGGGGSNRDGWIAAHEAGGCAPGINLIDSGGADQSNPTVGSGGGYGAIYCFSVVP